MSIEEEQVDATVSEQATTEPTESVQEETKMVPLAALEAERRKRQEAEAKSQVYQEYLMRKDEAKKEPEADPEALVERKTLNQETALTKREILEQVYIDMNPEGVQRINKYLPQILEKKPWLQDTIQSATNRYARSHEIVMDYMHMIEPAVAKPAQIAKSAADDAKRIVQNSMKPGNPVNIGKSQNPGGAEYLKSIQGKREFREYRQKLLRG